MVRVSLDSKLLRTQPRHGKAPRFNETIVFSVTKSEKDLLNLPIEIAVCTDPCFILCRSSCLVFK